MTRLTGILCLCALYAAGCFVFETHSHAQSSGSTRLAAGAVATHVIGRLILNADGTAILLGYYPYIEGVAGPFFSGPQGEATAYFTFRTAPFQVQAVTNGSIVHLFSSPINDTAVMVTTYYNDTPAGDFTNPDSFSSGQAIGVFHTRRGMATAITGATGMEIGTLDLVSASDFTFQAQTYNLGSLGSSITQTTFYAGSPVSGSLASLPASIPFGGTAVVTGGTAAGSSMRVMRRLNRR